MSSYVRQIQTQLKQAGLYRGEIDGIAGKMTVDAVAKAIATARIEPEAYKAVLEQSQSNPQLNPNLTDPMPITAPNARYTLSEASLKNLVGVDSDLVAVVKKAITLSTQDFKVIEGVRTLERQKKLMAQGATRTLKSKHLEGKAVDIVPIVNGKVSWDWQYYYAIAKAMQEASNALKVNVTWGGAWQSLNGNTPPKQLVDNYVKTKKAQGKEAFTDGPHYQLG